MITTSLINTIFYVYFALNVIMAIAFAVIVQKVKADEKGKAFVTLISLLVYCIVLSKILESAVYDYSCGFHRCF